MNSFFVSFQVVFPIFLMMLLGSFIKKINLVNENTVKQINNVIFRILLPVMIFKNMYDSSIADVFNLRLVIFSVVFVIAMILLLFLVVPLVEKDNSKRGVMIQAIFRSNFVIFGIPVTQALCEAASSESLSLTLGSASVLVAVVVPIYNFAAVITLEVYNNTKPDFVKILKGIITNPLIIASVLGIIISVTDLKFLSVLESTMGSVAAITTPLALIMLGASIRFDSAVKNWKYIAIGVSARLLIVPSIALALAVFVFGFKGADLIILMSLFASPVAVSSFTMAQQMGGDSDLAGQLVMFTTTFSVLSVFMWIVIIISMGLL